MEIPTKSAIRHMVRSRREEILCRAGGFGPLASSFCDRLFQVPELQAARTICVYMSLPDEVPTVPLLYDLFYRVRGDAGSGTAEFDKRNPRRIAVPWCQGPGQMKFIQIKPTSTLARFATDWATPELVSGAYHIKEPCEACRSQAEREILPCEADVVIVPGLAFTRNGCRLGRGKGFYDRFLAQVRPDALRIGLAFEEQMFSELPCDPHDQPVDCVFVC
ncbi:MAG: 5-formyltetrahydrofolate cyclo-ligase [Planctomycetia bacterium]|nr:5-formyltetrahydrofolate cyclo-ligase [Planctomycetia bacterium]